MVHPTSNNNPKADVCGYSRWLLPHSWKLWSPIYAVDSVGSSGQSQEPANPITPDVSSFRLDRGLHGGVLEGELREAFATMLELPNGPEYLTELDISSEPFSLLIDESESDFQSTKKAETYE